MYGADRFLNGIRLADCSNNRKVKVIKAYTKFSAAEDSKESLNISHS